MVRYPRETRAPARGTSAAPPPCGRRKHIAILERTENTIEYMHVRKNTKVTPIPLRECRSRRKYHAMSKT